MGKGVTDRGVRVGSADGCRVAEPLEFKYKGDSVAEVYCYFAGTGDLFQAHESAAGDIEVVHYDIAERVDPETTTLYIDVLNPESLYTFDLESNWTIVKP